MLMPYMGELPEQQGEYFPTYKIRTSYRGKGNKPKYVKDGKSIVIPYGLNLLNRYDRNDPVYLCEGETDMITLLQAGYNAIGIPGANSFKLDWGKYFTAFKMVVLVMDNDAPGRNLLKSVMAGMGEHSGKLFYMEMPRGVKDVNSFHCENCHKNIDTFKEQFRKLPPTPATLQGFEILASAGINIVTQSYIDSYIRVVCGDNKIEIDKFLDFIYKLQGKEQGITRPTLRSVAKQATQMMLEEAEEAQEQMVAAFGEDLVSKGDGCYTYKKFTVARYR